ncbi:probable E3 ubiquitin-protein ligase xbos32 [Phtheirospermum japonicum]|uniref:RING-type E3 ubiquitin transferase n=1 Tax=Phtheirospermum japonicum TaxID=374723 RepID=A0A830BEW7_9LAMI|nr:probable E3 ubiquitin-protein ligase xbos32 [Phtheirospermum japonicum]
MTTMRFLSLVGNSFGCSASGERLVSAARDGDFQEAKALLEYNPRLARYSTFGVRNSPLHYSAAQGHHEIVALLLESGVDVNLRNYRGQTALMQACQYGHWEVVQILVLFKADIYRADYLNAGTALHLAALNGHFRCIRLILADHIPSTLKFRGRLRKKSRNNESVSEFDEGALYAIVNRPADGGVTALHMAALNGHVETVHLLLDLGASALVAPHSIMLHVVVMCSAARSLLIASGASLATENANGDWLEDILTQESGGERRVSPSPYLCLPLMSIVEIARECGWRSNDLASACLDPCVVCLERKCTVAAEGCLHEFCTHCALYLCSTNSTSTVARGPPGSIACPLCRHGIVSFVKLVETRPLVKEMARMRSVPFCTCSADGSETQQSLETALCKPDFHCAPLGPFSSFQSGSCQSLKFSPGLCLGARDTSPTLVPRNEDSSSEEALVKCSRLSFRRSSSQNEGRRWLCSFIQSVPTGSS